MIRSLVRLARRVRQVRAMPWSLRYEYAVVLALACLTEAALRFIPLTAVAPLLGVSVRPEHGRTQTLDALPPWALSRVRVVRVVMARWPVDGVCLRSSLVTGQRLRSLQPALRVGVARSEAEVRAHAWLEVGGRSLDPMSARFAALSLP